MRTFGKRKILATAAVAAAIIASTAGVAVAAFTTKSGGAISRVSILTQSTPDTYSTTSWHTIGTTSVSAPRRAIILARFTAESSCYGGRGWCSVRILIDGVEAEPVAGIDFAFDDNEGLVNWESHSVERSRRVTGSGSHSVAVQVAQPLSGVKHRLDDWSLSAFAVNP
jgi:hypothetical protein